MSDSKFVPAVPLPVLQVSDVEKRAVAKVSASVDRYAQQVLARHEQPTLKLDTDASREKPTLVPTFIERQNAVERSKIQAEIDALL